MNTDGPQRPEQRDSEKNLFFSVSFETPRPKARGEKKKFSQVSFFHDTNLSAPAKNCFLSSDTTADKTLSVHSHTCSGGFRLNHKVLSGTLYSLKLSVILKTFNSSVIYDNTMICFIRGRGRAGPALFFRGRQILIIAKIPAAQ